MDGSTFVAMPMLLTSSGGAINSKSQRSIANIQISDDLNCFRDLTNSPVYVDSKASPISGLRNIGCIGASPLSLLLAAVVQDGDEVWCNINICVDIHGSKGGKF